MQHSFVLMPTCNAYARVAEVSATLLARHWPAHPMLHVLHYERSPRIRGAELHEMGRQAEQPWLATMARFLASWSEPLFVLMLDDYAPCGPAHAAWINRAMGAMLEDPSIGMIPLCWYPAMSRIPRPGRPELLTLGQPPILLQAAIWRRTWFLELASRIDPRASPWAFESLATRAARQGATMDVCAAPMPAPPHDGGPLIDGFDKSDWPLPYHNLMHRGHPDPRHNMFLHRAGLSLPSQGLGDTIARLANVTGLARAAQAFERLTGRPCGCQQRRQRLNSAVPYS